MGVARCRLVRGKEDVVPVTMMLHLFGKPAWELNKEGEEIVPDDLRALAESLHLRLLAAADAIEKLTGKGWEASLTLYDITLSHPYIDTEADARDQVEGLGLDPEDFSYMEFEDEDWDEEGFSEEEEEE
jgi:hypothetical protein